MVKKSLLTATMAALLISCVPAHAGWFDWFSFSDFSPKTAIITTAFTGLIAGLIFHRQYRTQQRNHQHTESLYQEDNSSLRAHFNQQLSDNQKLNDALSTKRKRIASLKTILSTTTDEISAIKMRNCELATEKNSLQSNTDAKITDLETRLNAQVEERRTMIARTSELERRLGATQTNLSLRKRYANEAAQRIDTERRAKEEAQKQARKERFELGKQIDLLRQELDNLQSKKQDTTLPQTSSDQTDTRITRRNSL